MEIVVVAATTRSLSFSIFEIFGSIEAIMTIISSDRYVLRRSREEWESLEVFSPWIGGDASCEKPSGFVVKVAARIRKKRS